MDHQRHLGLFGATALGVGASVGGGILALAGVAFATTGPSAIVAFGLNGAIAFLTATSLARLARRFTDSGGFYLYAKKLLSIKVAFVGGGSSGSPRSWPASSMRWASPPSRLKASAGGSRPSDAPVNGRRRMSPARAGHRTMEAAGIGAGVGEADPAGPFGPRW